MEYSFYDLEQVKQDIEKMIQRSSEERYTRKLMYGLRKNQDIIESEQKIIRKDLEDNVEGFDEYEQKRFDIAIECGGKAQQVGNGKSIIKNPEDINEEQFQEKVAKLTEEYKETLDKQQEVFDKNQKILEDKIAEPAFYKLNLEDFPELVTDKDMPKSIIKLIGD